MKYQRDRFTWTRKTTAVMGKVEADIELINGIDADQARKNIVGEEDVIIDPNRMELLVNPEFPDVGMCRI